MKPKSPIVDPGTYFLTWPRPGEIWLTNLNYFPEYEWEHRLGDNLNWIIVHARSYFEGTCMEDVVVKPAPLWSFDDSNGFYPANEISFSVDWVEKKCECGAESIGYNLHSTWCMKYES